MLINYYNCNLVDSASSFMCAQKSSTENFLLLLDIIHILLAFYKLQQWLYLLSIISKFNTNAEKQVKAKRLFQFKDSQINIIKFVVFRTVVYARDSSI